MIHDLHMHTTSSDGSLSPDRLIAYSREHGVDVMSITDHDSTAAYRAIRTELPAGLTLVPGIELSTTWMDRGIHILGLNIDIDSEEMTAGVAFQATARERRAVRIAARLERSGIDNPLAAVRTLAGDAAIGRPHFAQHLVEIGAVRNVRTAFRKYLGAGRPGDVRQEWASMPEVIGWIRASGGLAVLAHPAKYGMTNTKLRALLDDFVAAGGAGIEVVSGRQDPATTRRIAELAADFGLAASIGSDFHTPDQPWSRPGGFSPLPDGLEPVWERW